MKKIYHFHPETREYLGEAKAARSPADKEVVYLIPAWATLKRPPTPGEHQAAVFRDDAWELVSDRRGQKYWLADRSDHVITELGVEPPAGALDERPPLPLTDVKAQAFATTDGAAEAARLQFITDGVGQAMTYQLKHDEALALQDDGSPNPANYPLLAACIGTDGATLSDVAATVISTRNLWVIAASEIEGTRRSAKMAIADAVDHAAINLIIAGLSWPNPS